MIRQNRNKKKLSQYYDYKEKQTAEIAAAVAAQSNAANTCTV